MLDFFVIEAALRHETLPLRPLLRRRRRSAVFFLVNLTGGGEPVGAIEGLAQKFATDAARFQFVPYFQAAVAAVTAQIAFGKAGVALPAAFREGFENGGDVFGGKFAQFGGKLGAAVFDRALPDSALLSHAGRRQKSSLPSVAGASLASASSPLSLLTGSSAWALPM